MRRLLIYDKIFECIWPGAARRWLGRAAVGMDLRYVWIVLIVWRVEKKLLGP